MQRGFWHINDVPNFRAGPPATAHKRLVKMADNCFLCQEELLPVGLGEVGETSCPYQTAER